MASNVQANAGMSLARLTLLLFLFVTLDASAGTRVFDVIFEGKKYYALILEPIREAPFRLGYSRTVDLRRPHELGTTLVDVRKLDPSFAALAHLLLEGAPLSADNIFLQMEPAIREKLRAVNYNEHIAQVVEEHMFHVLEEWSIAQYLKRKRFDHDVELQIRAEFEQIKDGYGWVAILDENKNIVSTLVTAVRTHLAPKLPAETRFGMDVPDPEYHVTMKYNPIGHPMRAGTRLVAPVLTAELKRFIVDRKSPLYMLPILLYFGEKSGMTWQGPRTRFVKLHDGKPVRGDNTAQPVVGQYVLECDEKVAEVYMKPPFSFPEPQVKGDERIFTFSREHFMKMFDQSLDVENGKISGLTFFEKADVQGGRHTLDSVPPSLRNGLRNLFLKPPTCESDLTGF